MSIGSLTNTSLYLPYDRFIEVQGIKILVLPEVNNEFPVIVASIYNQIFSIGDNSDSILRDSLLSNISTNQIGQRIGFSGPDYYESIGQPSKWEQFSGSVELVDFIWQIESSESEQIAEIIEHQLHTITGLTFKYTYPKQWNYYDPNSDINIAMQQAYSAGIYNTDGMYNDVDSQGLMEVLPQEFAFWVIVTAWDYIEKYFPNNENEWSLKSSTELKEKLPLAYKLYEETVLPVITKPSESFLDSLSFSYSSNTDQVINDSSSEDLSLSQTTIT